MSELEERLAEFLAEALEQLEQGVSVDPVKWFPHAPNLLARARRMLQELQELQELVPDLDCSRKSSIGSAVLSQTAPWLFGFTIIAKLGEGAFGEVWLAEDQSLERFVALKTLKTMGEEKDRPGRLAALRQDALRLANIEHPNVVRVYNWCDTDQAPFLVLQYVRGQSLHELVAQKGSLPWERAVRYATDVGEALAEVHQMGVVHRDVKPANILWNPRKDEVFLTDFGIAVRLTDAAWELAGTPLFMAPEAFAGEVEFSMDVYSLAASLFWLLTGEAPFHGKTWQEIALNSRDGLAKTDPRVTGMPEEVEQLIRSGLSPLARTRPTMEDYARSLRGTLNQRLLDTIHPKPSQCQPNAQPESQPGSSSGKCQRPIELSISRWTPEAGFTTMMQSERKETKGYMTRDIQRVPKPPPQVHLQTGDQIRIAVHGHQSGYFALINVGPTGNFNLLEPSDINTPWPEIAPAETIVICDLVLAPPAGQERILAIWSKTSRPVRQEELESFVGRQTRVMPRPYYATRDIVSLEKALHGLPNEDWAVVALELDHHSS